MPASHIELPSNGYIRAIASDPQLHDLVVQAAEALGTDFEAVVRKCVQRVVDGVCITDPDYEREGYAPIDVPLGATLVPALMRTVGAMLTKRPNPFNATQVAVSDITGIPAFKKPTIKLEEHPISLEEFLFDASTLANLTEADRSHLADAQTGYSILVATELETGCVVGLEVARAGDVEAAFDLVAGTLMGSLAFDVGAKTAWYWRISPAAFRVEPRSIFADARFLDRLQQLDIALCFVDHGPTRCGGELLSGAMKEFRSRRKDSSLASAMALYLGLSEGMEHAAAELKRVLGRWACDVYNSATTRIGSKDSRQGLFDKTHEGLILPAVPVVALRRAMGREFAVRLSEDGVVVMGATYNSKRLQNLRKRLGGTALRVRHLGIDVCAISVFDGEFWISVENTDCLPRCTSIEALRQIERARRNQHAR